MDMDNFRPHNPLVNALLTDMYQISMAYAYFRAGKHQDNAVFDLFFRTTPFNGQYAVFAGLEDVLRLIKNWGFSAEEVQYVRTLLPNAEEAFFEWLSKVDCSEVTVYSLEEGTVCFPRIPLLRVEGPIGVCQLLETALLNIINFATLVATNAARFRLAAGPEKKLLEFGLRRAQGPDGAVSASRYCFIGGFNGTSNVLAGKLFGIQPSGTMAHAFITSYSENDTLPDKARLLVPNKAVYPDDTTPRDLLEIAMKYYHQMNRGQHLGELKSFVSYAVSYPENTLCLVDTYNTMYSGVPNFICVALALHELGYRALGVRLDSGDLAYLSRETRKMFVNAGRKYGVDYLGQLSIVASNDLDENTILSLNQQGHEIDVYGIGTKIVTCYSQPALGGVYKLVEINGNPRIKLSEEIEKVTLPGRKEAYRLCVSGDQPVVDLLIKVGATPPQAGDKLLCQHPFIERKRAYVTPSKVIPLHTLVWDKGKVVCDLPDLATIRSRVINQLKNVREDHLRPLNPTPYKVSVNQELFAQVRDMWLNEAPITELL